MADDPRIQEHVLAFTNTLTCPIMLLSEQPFNIATLRPILRHMLSPIRSHDQQQLWKQALGSHLEALNGRLPQLVAQFSLPPNAIHAAAAEALGRPADSGHGTLTNTSGMHARRKRRAHAWTTWHSAF